MAESGCLRDLSVQNLDVVGTTEFKGTVLGQRRRVIALTNAATTARSLVADESGALVTIDPSTDAEQTVTVTMPALEAGLEFTFAITADAGNAAANVVFKTTANAVDFKGMLTIGNAAVAGNAETAASNNVLELAHSKIDFDPNGGATTFGNTVFTCTCDGSHWITTGNTTAVAGAGTIALSANL